MPTLNRQIWSSVAVFVTLTAGPASAQTVANSFEELHRVLKKGETVIVTDASGQRVKGKVADLSTSSLVVFVPETRTFTEGTVTEIRSARGSSRKGALIGVGVGAGLGAAVILAKCRNGPDCTYALKVGAGYAGMGAAIGAGIGALNNGGRVVYRSRQHAGSLILSPLLGKDGQGALVSVRF